MPRHTTASPCVPPVAIVRDPQRRGGAPIIEGTSTRVMDVAVRYEALRMSPREIIIALPHLSLAAVHTALAYYYEHRPELDRSWSDAMQRLARLRRARARRPERARARSQGLPR